MDEFIMKQLFLPVLSLSLSGTLIGLFIAVIHPITRKYFSQKWNYYIWLLVIVRLILPFHFEPDPSAGVMQTAANISADTLDMPDTVMTNNAHNVQINKTTVHTSAVSETQYPGARLLTAAAYLWLLGTITALFIKIFHYLRFQSRIKKDCVQITDHHITTLENIFCANLHIENIPDIYKSASVSSPMTVGLWHPVIIIPEIFFDGNVHVFQLVLHHELVHVARKDLLYKWIYQLLLCIHWFNPVLYLIGRQINSDCELSCDEIVLAKLTDTEKQMYGNVLLDTAARNIDRRQNALSTTLLDNKNNLKKRLDNILHYKKATRLRAVLSICMLAVTLLFTACSSAVWIVTDDETDVNDYYTNENSDEASDDSVFSQILSSFLSSERFMNSFGDPDHSSDAWKVYDNIELLTGDDIQDNWSAYNYAGGNKKITATGLLLYGSDSIVIAYADKDVDVTVQSSFEINEGKFKIIYAAPDNSIVTLNDTGADTTQTITMKKGRNVLKMIGQGAKLENLHIDYSSLKESDFIDIYYSDAEEYAGQIKNNIISGKSLNKDKIIDVLSVLDAAEVSDVFNALLAAGTTFTDDELQEFFLYSDTTLTCQYLLQAIRTGDIEPPSADTLSCLMPYLNSECCTELLKTLPVEEFYDAFEDTIYYLDSSQINECLIDYLSKGGVLTDSMYDEIVPYLNKDLLLKLNQLPPLRQ